jgi:DNA modification methylase
MDKRMNVIDQRFGEGWAMYLGDSCEALQGIPSDSIHYSIFSPPFASLYTYSASERDLGNARNDEEFYEHFKFIVSELYRVIMPGRLLSFHCMDIPAMKERDGFIGLKDFPAQLREIFELTGFLYHSRAIIWKDPLIEATRTKALGLMHKQVMKDSAMCRQGLPDQLLTMRKPGVNPEPVSRPDGFTSFIGEDEPKARKGKPKVRSADIESYVATTADDPVYSHQVWRRYASPVWMDIRQTRTLNVQAAREQRDERHICPLQLDVIERAVELWTNPHDTVLSPFAGIGSEGYVSIQKGRRFIGIELKESYYKQAVANLQHAEKETPRDALFATA